MRRKEFTMSLPEAVAMLRDAPTLTMAGVTPEGEPVLRRLHGVVVGGLCCFHASPKGEKVSLTGRPVVISVDEDVARIPSFFVDPEKACPATTLYRSVLLRGTLVEVDDPATKARALQALMEKLQPEGGHAPITHDDPRYRSAVKGILIAGVSLEGLVGKSKLLQNRAPEDRADLCEKLWRRGEPGDARAVELVRRATTFAPPEGMRDVGSLRLVTWLDAAETREAALLSRATYWNEVWPEAALHRAFAESTVVVAAKDASGRVVATARGVSDGSKRAFVYDVFVAEAHRAKGVGEALVRLLLDHGAMRAAGRVTLGTRDAMRLYEKLGFRHANEVPRLVAGTVEMTLVREPSASSPS